MAHKGWCREEFPDGARITAILQERRWWLICVACRTQHFRELAVFTGGFLMMGDLSGKGVCCGDMLVPSYDNEGATNGIILRKTLYEVE